MIETRIQMRFADVDMLGHVNNVNQQHYFDIGKSDYFGKVLESHAPWKENGFITVTTNNTYFSQIRYEENISVRTKIENIGNKSITIFQQVVNVDGEVKSESRSVLVAFNFARQESIPVPEKWRERITSYEKM